MATLDAPLTINGTRLRNRLVLAPIHTNFATADGQVTGDSLGFYRQRARDLGLVIVEATAARPDGRITPYSHGLWSDAHVPGLSRLATAIKGEGATAVIQIVHSGARGVPVEEGIRGASPSGRQIKANVEPTVIDEGQIAAMVADFGAAAARAQQAGFDGVEVHGAHFYLLSQFLSPLTNQRQDRYGGDVAGRATFALEAVRAVRQRVGASYLVLFRLNSYEGLEGAQTLEDSIAVARLLKTAGVDAIDASVVLQIAWGEVDGQPHLQTNSMLPKPLPGGTNTPAAARIQREAGLPVITVGKLGSAEAAAQAVGEDGVDLAAIARQMIADPLTGSKLLAGRGDEIVRCDECGTCLTLVTGRWKPMKCSLNQNLTGTAKYTAARKRRSS